MKEEIADNLYKSLDSIIDILIRRYNLEFKKDVEHLSEGLYRWIDFRLRYIDPKPRFVIKSKNFPLVTDALLSKSLKILENEIINGVDINKYQSKTLIRFNDVSGKKKNKRTDLLWADWGIIHLHITDVPKAPDDFFSARTLSNGESWILFCLITDSEIGLIDLKKHSDEHLFNDIALIKSIKKSWPDYMEQFRLNGVLPSRQPMKNDDIKYLRNHGITTHIEIDDKVYVGPGMGITTAATPTKVTLKCNHIRRWLNDLACALTEPDHPINAICKMHGIESSILELGITPRGLALLSKDDKIALTFSSHSDDYKMCNLILPNWALDKIKLTSDCGSSSTIFD